MFRADLHCHSSSSDGTLTPSELIALAKKQGLSGLSITDHDTIDAYENIAAIAQEAGILIGTGVEFSCVFQKMSVHVLGYDYSLDSTALRAFCEKHQIRRELRNKKILDKLRRLNMPIEESELLSADAHKRSTGRPHIAEVMVKKGYVNTFKEAFQNYLGEGRCCYDPGESFSVEETLEVIHSAGGKAFIAHPHLLDNGKKAKELLALPFDGIECYYAKCTPDLEKKWVKMARAKNLLISGGSDFHGDFKSHISLGCSWVNEETFRSIFQKLF